MPAFLIALLLGVLASTGGRDQLLVAQLSASFRKPLPVLVVAWISNALTGTAAVVAGAWLAPMMPPGGKLILLAIALGFAAVEMAWHSLRKPAPKEPTRSLVAMLIVLLAHQLGDAARFILFALAVWSASTELVAAGGILGTGAALTLAWLSGAALPASPVLRIVRPLTAALLAVAAAAIAVGALGLV